MNRIDSTRAIEKIWNAECKNGQLLYWNYNEECWAIKDDLKLLTKYKKTFEIFKGKKVNVYPKFDGDNQYIIILNKNEYELLEELMKGA